MTKLDEARKGWVRVKLRNGRMADVHVRETRNGRVVLVRPVHEE